jgi:hyperosmotically inducible protein
MPPKKYVALALVPALVLLTACAIPDFDFVSYPPWTTVYNAARDERNVADILFDKAISTQIKTALLQENGELGLRVKVYCFLRRVTLLGQVDDDAFKALAVATAWETEGVRGVATGWVAPGRAGTAAADLEIAARLRAALVGDQDISATQIEAEVFGGAVYLTGMVRSQQDAGRALAHARWVRGVSSVISLLIPSGQD